MSAAIAKPLGPKGMPILGSLPTLRSKGILDFYVDLWREYGDVSHAKLGPLQSMVFVRPEHIQHILVQNPDKFVKGISHAKLRNAIGNGILTLEGEKWYRQHKLMQPTYTRKNVNIFGEIMQDESRKLITRWQANPNGHVVDINAETTRITMSVISRAMFGIDIGEQHTAVVGALHDLLEYTSQTTNSLIDTPLFIPTKTNLQLKRSKKMMRDFIMDIIRQRRTEGLRDDLLSMLMSAQDAETGEVMSDEQLHDEVVITIFAGHETTASLLTWAFYLLSQHPDVEAKLHTELAQVLAGRAPTLEDMGKLPYTRMIIDETLRLYSPVPILARDTVEADSIGGHAVSKGTMVVLLPYATHRHPEFWEKPLQFYPEHFMPEAVAARPRFAYLPFGTGQRICIGMHFALLEATLVLADIAQHYQLRLTQPHDGKLRYIGVVRPISPIMMKLEAR